MLEISIANFVMLIHFGLAMFITLGLFIIPLGYKCGWNWTQHWNFRLLHLSMIGFVTAETIVGLTCPLTALENLLRDVNETQTFAAFWINKILYWDFPRQTFILLYSLCFVWVILLWKYCPPNKGNGT